MSQTLAPADASHYYQRLAELSTLPFWQREEFTEPAGPERGHVCCLLEGLPGGARTQPRRETASSVIVVARGTGTLICGGQTFALLPSDVAAIPAWTWHQLTASDRELVLLRLTDRPIHDAFGLFQAEEEV